MPAGRLGPTTGRGTTGRWEDGCVPHRSAYPMSLVDQWDQRVRPGVRQAGPKAGGLALTPGQRCRLIFTKDYPAAHRAKFLPCGAGLDRTCLTSFLPGSLALVRDFGPGYRNHRNKMTKACEIVGGSSCTAAVQPRSPLR